MTKGERARECRVWTARLVGPLVLVGWVGAAQATDPSPGPERISLRTTANPPQERKVSFEEVRYGALGIKLRDVTSGEVDLYPLSATPQQRARESCTLPVKDAVVELTGNGACASVLAPLFQGRRTQLAVSLAGLAHYAVISYEPPRAYSFQTQIGPERTADAGSWDYDWKAAVIPSTLVPQGEKTLPFFVPLGTNWVEGTFPQAQGLSEPSRHAIELLLEKGQEVTFVAKVIDVDTGGQEQWRTFPLRARVPESTPETPTPTPEEPPLALAVRCGSAAMGLPAGQTYVLCVDAFQDGQGMVALECENKTCKLPSGGSFLTRRSFHVFGWYDTSQYSIKVTLSGTPGLDPIVNDRTKVLALDGARQDGGPRSSWNYSDVFPARLRGTADLVVDATHRADPDQNFSFTHTLLIVPYYRFAVRVGLAFNWMPYAREVDVRTDALGQRYVALSGGGEQGLVSTSVVGGFTGFLRDIPEGSLDTTLGLGVRLSLVSLRDGKAKPFESLQVGFELVIGPDFSLGAFAGLAWLLNPQPGFEPGRLLTGDSIPTQVGFTPTFSVTVDFTPEFLKRITEYKP